MSDTDRLLLWGVAAIALVNLIVTMRIARGLQAAQAQVQAIEANPLGSVAGWFGLQ